MPQGMKCLCLKHPGSRSFCRHSVYSGFLKEGQETPRKASLARCGQVDEIWEKRGIRGAAINRDLEECIEESWVNRESDLGGIREAGFFKRQIGDDLLLEVDITPGQRSSILEAHSSITPQESHGLPIVVGHRKNRFEFLDCERHPSHSDAGRSFNSFSGVVWIHALAPTHIEEIAQDLHFHCATGFAIAILSTVKNKILNVLGLNIIGGIFDLHNTDKCNEVFGDLLVANEGTV